VARTKGHWGSAGADSTIASAQVVSGSPQLSTSPWSEYRTQ